MSGLNFLLTELLTTLLKLQSLAKLGIIDFIPALKIEDVSNKNS